ncbi:MAG: polyphenol oxidase [Thermoanaerobaculia bacterium]|jgi:polyphenol oxidase|nr:polyphenol oxidase [Thermoanaerobaculia bacterium]
MSGKKIVLGILSSLLISVAAFGQGCPPPANIPIGNCSPKSGTPTNFTGDTGPMRTRKSIYALNATEIAELRLAFQRLRALPATDPRAWLAQANVHCWYCAGDMSTAADVHVTWAFMPWHRDYLYMIEKILGQLVNNPKFAIPYWDWNTPGACPTTGNHQQMPPPYTTSASNSLFDCYRQATASSTMNSSTVVTQTNNIMNTYNTFPLFFGGPSTSAALWPGPHGYVHLFVGNLAVGPAKTDMGVLETASRDPLFWAHHANIDRLWDVWVARYGTPTYPANFLSQSWTFWNQNATSQLIRINASDAANRAARLHYQYAEPSCTPTAASYPLQLAEAAMLDLGPAPQTITTEARPAAKKFTLGGSTGHHVVLHLEQVTVPSDESAILRVFVGRPNATAALTEDDHLVQELYIVPSHEPGTVHGNAAHQHSFNVNIALPDFLAGEVETANGQMPITIVPVGGNPQGLLTAAPAAVHVKLRKPYFTAED